jgi:hypothetical protein
MTEHEFLAAMLAFVAAESSVAIVVLVWFAYRVYRGIERIEGLTAATYLEARKALGQSK